VLQWVVIRGCLLADWLVITKVAMSMDTCMITVDGYIFAVPSLFTGSSSSSSSGSCGDGGCFRRQEQQSKRDMHMHTDRYMYSSNRW
jgi:hypothetical protein